MKTVSLPQIHRRVPVAEGGTVLEAALRAGARGYLLKGATKDEIVRAVTAVAEAVRVLILEEIPRLSRSNFNEAKRFVTLIDALYENRVKLFATAAAERLADEWETKVSVTMGKRKGKMVVEFGDQEDFERIMALIEGQH